MSFEIIINRLAELDLNEAIIWYEEIKAGLGFQLILDFGNTVSKIKRNPHFASTILEDVRATSLKKYPYEIVYRIDEAKMQVRVIAFSHHKRKPNWFIQRD